jgi:hypothetical protein
VKVSFDSSQADSASKGLRATARDQTALVKLAVVLRTITQTVKPNPPAPIVEEPKEHKAPPVKVEVEMSKTNSSQGSDIATKKKSKKKKRSVLANQSNPHHVDNC